MNGNECLVLKKNGEYHLVIKGRFDIHRISKCLKKINKYPVIDIIDLKDTSFLDSAGAIFLNDIIKKYDAVIINKKQEIEKTFELVRKSKISDINQLTSNHTFFYRLGKAFLDKFSQIASFLEFIGMLFAKKVYLLFNPKNFRYKEIAFEINQSAIRAVGVVILTNFLVGVVVAYQSGVQLKQYGANIFIVDMLGISILRELAPMITAIVIAGRSGSAYTAEIGAMKITDELDAMRTMGFDPYYFLVIPRIIALMISMPILIFLADISGMLGGMVIANSNLDISVTMFLERFNEVIAFKHFGLGLLKGPFFAFLIATISIYRGFKVKDDTQSIGKNTTKSVVESIFAVIVCDALFSILFTNLGI